MKMADGKQCDRCKEWGRVEEGDLLPDGWGVVTLPAGVRRMSDDKGELDLCAACEREFLGAKAMAAKAYADEFNERFWPKESA